MKIQLGSILVLLLVGCTTTTTPPQPQPKPAPTPVAVQPTTNENGVTITPYNVGEIKRESRPIVVVPKQQPLQHNDGSMLPAFKSTLAQAQQAFKQNNLDRAEQLGLQAQRLAPQSSEGYLLLSQIALQKNKLPQAKSLANRGISLSSDAGIKKQLWQVVLRTAQLQNDTATIQKAQSALN